MGTAIQDGHTIVFIGDSITDCGRRDKQHAPLGCGYVSFVNDFLVVRDPEKSINVINTGIGGNTVEDLRSRWIDDAMAHKPDWLSIKIGINDVNRWLSNPEQHTLQDPETYAKHYDDILACTKKKYPTINLLLIDPFYGSLDHDGDIDGAYRGKVHALLPDYINAVDALGEKYGARRVKTHDLFHAQYKHQHPSVYFPNEPVHPNEVGHMLIAEAVYKALEK